ncbi:MAG: hypothetical protein IPK72_20985 [Candidatus Eisenbacteria bacterium]|nr:hypothetical protein [Candidatus Eisenbacteria bacterium]
MSSPTGKRRGRPANVQETARRVAVLERVQTGEITKAEAAAELGIAYGTWAGWRALYGKRAGVIPAPIARASVEPTSIPTGKPAADVAKLVERVEELERFGRELRHRLRDPLALVERWVGWGGGAVDLVAGRAVQDEKGTAAPPPGRGSMPAESPVLFPPDHQP